MRDATGRHTAALRLALVLVPCLLGLALGCATTSPTTRLQAQDDEELDKDLREVKTLGDLTDVGNASPLPVSGVGVVIGLAGTGGAAPPGYFRDQVLIPELRKQKVADPEGLLKSPEASMVFVSGQILPGTRKGDPIDVEVYLPDGGKATSLRGGYLAACSLYNYDHSRHLNPQADKGDRVLLGHVVARAQGPVQAGFDDDEVGQRRGHIWEGGAALIDRPFLLLLKNDQKFARVASAVIDRINSQFQEDPQRQLRMMQNRRLLMLGELTGQINDTFAGQKARGPVPGKGEMAAPFGKDAIVVRVPWEYRLNPERYLRVVRLLPLREAPELRSRYRQKLEAMLLDPARSVRAALRLEALGKESVPLLRAGLRSDHPLVRFCAAEALTYLGSPSGADELAGLARKYDALRAYCLMALASLDEPASRERLAELLAEPSPELRYGAFRALRLLDEADPHVQGALVNKSFWVHRVAPESPPLVHFTLGQRAEVVLFGGEHRLRPPVSLRAQEFTVRADAADDRCSVKRFLVREGRVVERLCSLDVEDVLRTMAELGAQYPEVVEVLRGLDEAKAASCPVRLNALPGELPAEELAALGRNADAWRLPAADGDVRQASHQTPAGQP